MDEQELVGDETDISYHAVEKDGVVTAIWEMQGRKHLRTIDPRSEEGKNILGSYTIDEPVDAAESGGSSDVPAHAAGSE